MEQKVLFATITGKVITSDVSLRKGALRRIIVQRIINEDRSWRNLTLLWGFLAFSRGDPATMYSVAWADEFGDGGRQGWGVKRVCHEVNFFPAGYGSDDLLWDDAWEISNHVYRVSLHISYLVLSETDSNYAAAMRCPRYPFSSKQTVDSYYRQLLL